MRVETFYFIVDEAFKMTSTIYAQSEILVGRSELTKVARNNPGKKFHLVKRVSSCKSNDLVFEDSCDI